MKAAENGTAASPALRDSHVGGPGAEPLRVLLFSQYYWPENFIINDVVSDLRANGCEVTVLTGQPNYPDGDTFQGYRAWRFGRQRHPQGYEIVRVPVVPRKKGGLRRVLNYASFILGAALLGPLLLRRQNFDVVFVYAVSPILQALPAILVSRIKGAALVIWVQDLWPDTLRSTGAVKSEGVINAVARVARFIYRRSDLLLAQSKGFVNPIQKVAGPGVPVLVHPNPGRELGEIDKEPPLQLDAGFNIVFAGNLGEAQSLQTILEAAERVNEPQCRFVIVGSGSRTAWLQSEIVSRGLESRVRLVGRYPASAMPAILHQASALLVTLARSENLALTVPSKVPVYLAAGRPILASLDGEAGEIIAEAGAGFTVPAEDAAALAKAVDKLIRMTPLERTEMGNAGRAYFEARLAPKKLALQLERHLKQAVATRRSAAAAVKNYSE
ncbi:glycosyltransferase family 4 protein [Devosia albogilva]|uniref:Glycosyltransferase family 4 protein n=1 Tax=Devosia albogilva TaxID=429726 RepID=A0ABW5QM89_9HYPH